MVRAESLIAVVLLSVFGCGGGGGGSAAVGDRACAEADVHRASGSDHWLTYDCEPSEEAAGSRSFFLAGVGGPEDFLYLSGDRRDAIVEKLVDEGGNGIYFHSIRSHGGDGGPLENPFVGNDPANGVDERLLDEWEAVFERLDDAGITLFFFLYDDGAKPFGCSVRLSEPEADYIETIVSRFAHHRHLIWMTQEEFDRGGGCPGVARQRALAAAIRDYDAVHAIGVHHMPGQGMQFGGERDVDVFGQQASPSWTDADDMHDRAGIAGWGDWVYVMAEARRHQDLLTGGNANREALRRSFWATAMAGGYVLLYDSFEASDPTDAMLNDLRRLQQFMESTRLETLEPDDGLAFGETKWVLADEDAGLYVLYSDDRPDSLGVKDLAAGTYRLSWFDPADGTRVERTETVEDAGDAEFATPAEIGEEAALYLRK